MQKSTTASFIEELVSATRVDSMDARRQHQLRQVLHGLVRQAKAEQMLEIRVNAARLCALPAAGPRRRPGKACPFEGENGVDARQQRFEFERDDKPG